jgi:DNA-binding transcriptional LysR family regulator
MLNLRSVETLRQVAERGSFSAAAEALRYTQPAVSRQVRLLERAVGMPLVIRSRQGVHLTAAGRLVVEHADVIRARLLRLETELVEVRRGSRVSVALGGFPTAFVGWIPAIVKHLLARDPHAQISLRRCGHDEAIALVRKADLDVAVVFARTDRPAHHDDVEIVDLGDEPMLALLPRGHPVASDGTVGLEALQHEPWIVGAPDPSSSVIVAACRQAGFEPQITYETDDPLAIQSLVAAGLGVSLTTPWLATALRKDVELRPLTPPAPSRHVQAVTAKPAGPGASLVLELAQKARTEMTSSAIERARVLTRSRNKR